MRAPCLLFVSLCGSVHISLYSSYFCYEAYEITLLSVCLCVCVSLPLFQFSMQSVSYQRKVGD
jgi:hypothetical protein